MHNLFYMPTNEKCYTKHTDYTMHSHLLPSHFLPISKKGVRNRRSGDSNCNGIYLMFMEESIVYERG